MSEADQAELRVALRRLQDERDILDRLYAVGQALDGDAVADFLDCYTDAGRFAWQPTPEGEFVRDVTGHGELERWYHERKLRTPPGREHHILTNPRISDIQPARAHAVSWYLIVRDYGGRPGVRSTGRYIDELSREPDGKWRIRERLARGDMPR